ncbi:MAG: DUF3108 domain-containing protein [Betaproteobacteria bacterium]|nr:MAG: DUF3108 domain-containing protein [Betaproteobacteria bacterium]
MVKTDMSALCNIFRTFRLTCYLLICVALLGLSTARAAPPEQVEITFEIHFGAIRLGIGEDRLKHDGKQYQVYSDTIPQGMAALFIDTIRRESAGSITQSGLRPVRFIERGRKQGIRAAEFDWTNERLRLIHGESNQVVDLPKGSIDQASLPYAFAFAGKIPDDFSVHVTDGRRIKEYQYRIIGRERLESALGEIDTIHIQRRVDPSTKRSFEFWVAVDQHYLPVQMRFTDKKGRLFESVVTSIRYP